MATLNQWGDDIEESIGDIVYEEIEDKAKEGAKDLTKDGAKMAAHGLDKVTDKIGPVKQAKDFVKDKIANNPIAKLKKAAKKVKDKAKKAAANAAKNGVHAVGKAALHGAKSAVGFIAAHPVVACIIIAVVLLLAALMGDKNGKDPTLNEGMNQSNDVLLDNPMYSDSDGVSDDDIVVVLMDDCSDVSTDSLSNDAIVTTAKEEKAAKIYSVFKTFNDTEFNNASLAGLLANLDAESSLDPSAIEGILDEYGVLGTKKAAAFQSIDNYTRNTLFPKYDRDGTRYVRDNYKTTDGHGEEVYYCALGLSQWTAGNAKNLLTAANTLSVKWYDMQFQLGYMVADSFYRPNFFTDWVANQYTGLTDDDYDDWFASYTGAMDEASIAEAWEEAVWESWVQAAKDSAVKVAHDYEGNTHYDEERKEAAETWYEIVSEWGDDEVDTTFRDSVGTFASQLGAVAEWNETADVYYRCTNNTIYDNSSIAMAAISYAWPKKDQSLNNGTALYQTVHDGIFPGDTIYKSCDRSVGLAVRWSGSDDEYPLSGTGAKQLPYLLTSPKWELVGMASDLTMEDLLPGDIFILNGHTFMYVGEEAIQSAYGSEAAPGSDTVEGSLGERSAGCRAETAAILNRGGLDWTPSRGIYYVFRCSNPDNSDTYKSIGAGAS